MIDICLEMVRLRGRYASVIVELAKEAASTGVPINRPVWWLEPYDQKAMPIDSGEVRGGSFSVSRDNPHTALVLKTTFQSKTALPFNSISNYIS